MPVDASTMSSVRTLLKVGARGLGKGGRALGKHGRAAANWFSDTIDWPLAVVFAGFLAAIPYNGQVGGVLTASSLWLTRWFMPDPYTDYEDAIAAAAVKRPGYQVKLATIDQNTENVSVVSFGPPNPKLDDRPYDMWVALAGELKPACAGARDPVLKLQQVLGLRPDPASKSVVTQLSVPRTALFRPCMGASDLSSDSCGVSFFEPPQAKPKTDSPDTDATTAPPAKPTTSDEVKKVATAIDGTPPGATKTAATTPNDPTQANAQPNDTKANPAQADYYERLTFVARQMWSTYRVGFTRTPGPLSGYPYTGYPFTGMGWTYNWGRGSNHVGVSEFVVRREPKVAITGSQTPAEFCRAAS